MNFLRRFLIGRNGPDTLSHIFLGISFMLAALSYVFPGLTFLTFLSYTALAYSLFRVLSRDVYRRRSENMRFKALTGRLLRRPLQKGPRTVRARQVKYRVFTCKSCKAKCRVPKGKGRVRITCKGCGNVFEGKT